MAEAEEGDGNEVAGWEEVVLELEVEAEVQGSGSRQRGHAQEQVRQDVHHIQILERGPGRRYQGQEDPMREMREVGEGTTCDRKLRAG